MPQNYKVKDLRIKISSLAELFGKRFMLGTEKDPKAKDRIKEGTYNKWLRQETDGINQGLAKRFFGRIGMLEKDFKAPVPIFAEKVAEIYSVKISLSIDEAKKEVDSVIQRKIKKYKIKSNGMISILNRSSYIMLKETINDFYIRYKGYYLCYMNWLIWTDVDGSIVPQTKVLKFLIKIDEIYEEQKMISTKLTTKHFIDNWSQSYGSQWGWGGVMIPLTNRLCFIFEKQYSIVDGIGYSFIYSRTEPINNLWGLLLAEPRKADALDSFAPPCATRILMKKINTDDNVIDEEKYINELGIFEPNELHEKGEIDEREIKNDLNLAELLSVYSK